MIRVRLLSEREHRQLWRSDMGYRDYEESQFYDLLREKGDFTDAESLALLRHLHGDEAVTGKWYHRTTTDGKACLPAISREAMYGLVVIENSRKGIYTPMEDAFTDFEVEQRMEHNRMGGDVIPTVWQVFEQLDIDVLLTYRMKDFSFTWEIPIDEEFILENYPLNGSPAEVHVVQEYLSEPEQRDGAWYIHNHFYDQKYHWAKDPEELVDLLHLETLKRPPLAKGVFSLETFLDMCFPEDEHSCSPLSQMRQEREEAEAMGIPYEAEQAFVRIINHMDYLPENTESRWLMYLIIEEYPDERFCLRDNISVKYPSYDELFYEARDFRKPDCEVFLLPVDVNECMSCAEDIHKAVCAFRMAGDVIETFGPEEGLREFEKLLHRAVESGRYEILDG